MKATIEKFFWKNQVFLMIGFEYEKTVLSMIIVCADNLDLVNNFDELSLLENVYG